jgi:hypothetical protein
MAASQINAHKVMADGTDVYVSSTNTDQSGLADFALPDLGNAQAYVFKAKNSFDNSWKTSAQPRRTDDYQCDN